MRNKWLVWAGWLVSLLPVFICLTSARWKLTHSPFYVREWQRIGWPMTEISGVATLQIVYVVLYLIPQTAVLGAVLLTAYLGGALASYVRIGEFNPPLVPLTTCLLAWFGLWLRDERVRALLPIRWSAGRSAKASAER